MRSVEVDGILSCYRAFTKAVAAPPSCSSHRLFVAFAPPVRLLTRNGARRPCSEYIRAKEEMEERLKAEAEEEAEAAAAAAAKARNGSPSSVSFSPVSVTVFEVAAWGRDSVPIAAALLKSRISRVVAGGENKLQPVDEVDLAARVVRELSLSFSPSPSSSFSSLPFAIVSVGGPRVLTWKEMVTLAGVSVGVADPLFVSVPRWLFVKVLVPAAELVSRISRLKLQRAGYLMRLAADVMATDLVAEEAVGGSGVGQARL